MDDNFNVYFQKTYDKGDTKESSVLLLKELGRLLATKKSDFVFLLNECDVDADEGMGDEELISRFIENVGENNKLALGASLLINMNNTKSGFDGDFVDDGSVKAGYYVLTDNFSGADGDDRVNANSTIGGAASGGVVGAIAGAVGDLAKLGGKITDRNVKKNYGVLDMLQKKQDAKTTMQQEVEKTKQLQLQAQVNKKKASPNKNLIIWGSIGAIVIVGIIVTVVLIKRNK